MFSAVEALGPGFASTVGVSPYADNPASAAPAVRVDVLTPVGLVNPGHDKPLVVVISVHVLDPGEVLHVISRG